MGKALILFAALVLSACQTNPAPLDDPRSVWCGLETPRRDATPETPRAELDRINAHNAKGVLWCGWRP